jgi:hypothetical protein
VPILANEVHASSIKNLVKGQFSSRSHAKDTITSTTKEARPNVGSYHVIVNFCQFVYVFIMVMLVSINILLFFHGNYVNFCNPICISIVLMPILFDLYMCFVVQAK